MELEGLDYNTQRVRIPVRHYGRLIFEVFEKLMTMPESEERTELAFLTACQMYRCLSTWGMGTVDCEKVSSDLERYTNGIIYLAPEEIEACLSTQQQQSKKKRRK